VLQCSDTTASIEEINKNKDYLGNNVPDPFSSTTTIPYKLHNARSASLIVSDILGRTLSEYSISPLNSSIEIDLKDVPNGIYFYKIIADSKLIGVNRMMVVK
jgi:hypothetical protein